ALPAGTGGVARIIIEPSTVGLVTNLASVSSDELDSFAADNTSQVFTPVNVRAELALSVATDPSTVGATSNLICTIVVTNSGPSTAQGVQLTSPLPSGVNLGYASPSQGSCANIAGTLRC